MAACSNSQGGNQEESVRPDLVESRLTHLEKSVSGDILQPKVDALLSERNQDEPTSICSMPVAAAPRASVPELTDRGEGDALLQMLVDEEINVPGESPQSENGDSALHVAASGGDLKTVMALLGAGARVNVLGKRMRSSLLCAVACGNLALVQRLLDAGAKIDDRNVDGATALEIAARSGFTEIVRSLVDAGAKVDNRNADGATALELAARNGFTETVCVLLKKGAEAYMKLLTCAEIQRMNVLLEWFLQKNVHVDACNEDGDPLSVQAAKAMRWEIVECLLEKGANPAKCKAPSESALVLASEDGQAAVVRHLLRRGAASNAEQVRKALAKAKSADVVWAFVDSVPHQLLEDAGSRGLLQAAADGRLEPMLTLLQAGVDINARNFFGETALHIAFANGHIACAWELLRRGADYNAKDEDGWTPLHRASEGGHVECVRELLAAVPSTDETENLLGLASTDEACNM